MKQTAVEWLVEELNNIKVWTKNDIILQKADILIEQAKEMEKQQIFDAQVDVLSEHIGMEHFRKQRDEGLLEQSKMYNENEVELITNEMVNWTIDNIGNTNPQSGKKFDEILAKYKNK
jgi:hypothetical protein